MSDIQDKEDKDSEAQIMEDTKNFSKPKYINSTAVVKYSAVQTPANFARLQCNTDLNLPPSNWLSSSANSYGLQHVLSHSTGFSSFRMAHMFPDCVGEVDVVSDAENIKTLLKIPYSRGPVSMMVHRIENTLLIDDFDIHKYLLRRAETEWDWLKKFFFEHIQKALNDKDKALSVKNKTRNALQQKSLMSKFLYHSLIETDNDAQSVTEETEHIDDLPASGPALPEPNVEEEVPDPNTDHTFNRNVLWTFENIQMLIGTDMPIFGGSTHPCISLRLNDMKKPISVLTGIDYWLDNLMSNVPEVVMCYHLNGIVQKYEFIKTEDLPHLENSKFSPKLIRDIAQNILSFLKSNATKAGHTYWLFKGKNDDFVKLYDLTSLCSGVLDEKGQNPFTVPVAMLLYRVARNMKNTSDGEIQAGTIRMLLKNCIDLLPKEKYPQIVTSSHYMLSDLYIPANTNPNSPGLDSNLSDEENIDLLIPNHNDIAIMNLNQANESDNESHEYRAPPPILGTVIERCQMALHHVAAGLNCLDFFPSNDSSGQTNTDEPVRKKTDEDNLKMSNPFEAIPMPYSQLNKNVKEEDKSKKSRKRNRNKKVQKKNEVVEDDVPKALLPKQKAEAMPTWQEPDRSDNASWKVHLKTLLFEKACLVYATLAEQEYLLENYGNSLRYIEALVKCQKIVKNANYTCQHVSESCLLGRAGDCFCMIEKHWSEINKYRREYEFATDIDREIMEEINKYYPVDSSSHEMWDDLLPKSIDNNEQLLLLSCKCYEQALASEPVAECENLMRRLGNVQNELGTLYMNKAAMTFNEDLKTTGLQDIVVYQTLLTKAAQYLEAGIRSFETVHDEANLSLLYSNMGRLMRTNAHICAPDAVEKQSELAGQEKHYYQKALSSYQLALAVLGNRQRNPDIWDAVMWELSTALYTMATLMQDYPNMRTRSQQDLERDVSEMLHKALRYCDMDTPGARQPIYQYRGAKIHHRLASLYHKTLRERYEDDTRTKNLVQICKLHYEQATKLMLLLEEAYEYLRIMLEYVALYELLFNVSNGVSKKHKYLLTALYLLFNTKAMLKYISEHESLDDNSESCKQTKGIIANESVENSENETCDKNSNKKSEETEQSTDVEQINEKRLISLVEQRLQFVLLNLTKLFAKPIKSANKEDENLGQVYKSMYSLSLRTKKQLQGVDLALHLHKLLIRLSDIVSNSIPKDLMQKIINNLIQN